LGGTAVLAREVVRLLGPRSRVVTNARSGLSENHSRQRPSPAGGASAVSLTTECGSQTPTSLPSKFWRWFPGRAIPLALISQPAPSGRSRQTQSLVRGARSAVSSLNQLIDQTRQHSRTRRALPLRSWSAPASSRFWRQVATGPL